VRAKQAKIKFANDSAPNNRTCQIVYNAKVMKTRFLLIYLLILLTGCATSRPSLTGSEADKARVLNPTPANPNMAVVYIVRDDKFAAGGVNVLIGIDHERFISLANNSFTRVDIPAGLYNFRFLEDAEDFNTPTSGHAHGSVPLMIKKDVANIVRFEGGNVFQLSKQMLYGAKHLGPLTQNAQYQIAYQPILANLKSLPPDSAKPRMTEAANPAPKVETIKPEISDSQFGLLKKKAKCNMKNDSWVYTGSHCKNGLAHGKGSAKDRQGLTFIGEFKAGDRIKGEIYQNGDMIFKGKLVNDKPEGDSICRYEGEYEECRFFRGKRIDTLYKIRKENAKMKAELSSNSSQRTNTQEKGAGDYAEDAIKKEAINRTANYIFDKLF